MGNDLVRETTKEKFLNYLKEEAVGCITTACKRLSISRQTINNWRKIDPEFDRSVSIAIFSGKESLADLAENALKLRIENGDTTAIIFTLKSLRRPFYGERQDYEENKKQLRDQENDGIGEPRNEREGKLMAGMLLGHYRYIIQRKTQLTEQQIALFDQLEKALKP